MMFPMLDLNPEQQDALWQAVVDRIRRYPEALRARRATPKLDREAVRAQVAAYDFSKPLDPAAAVAQVAEAVLEHHVHPPHPRYFGLFNPAATEAGVAGDALAAVVQPQRRRLEPQPLRDRGRAALGSVSGRAARAGPDEGRRPVRFGRHGGKSNSSRRGLAGLLPGLPRGGASRVGGAAGVLRLGRVSPLVPSHGERERPWPTSRPRNPGRRQPSHAPRGARCSYRE